MAPHEQPEGDLTANVDHWRRHGWVLMDGLIPAETVTAALGELLSATPDGSQAAGPTRRAEEPDNDSPRFDPRQFDGITLFPYRDSPTLNRLFVHPHLVAFAAAALGTEDLRLYQARVWSKYADVTDYDQPMHRDRNHSMIPLLNGSQWGHVEYFLYLHDVDEETGAPSLVPESATAEPIWPRPHGSGSAAGEPDELYNREVRGSESAGSVLAYRSDVWHRGRNLAPGRERHILVAAYRAAAAEWIGFDALHPRAGSSDFRAFVADSTAGELQLLGFPEPGHPVWNRETVDGLADMYPGLDVSPWRHGAEGRDS